MSAFNGKKIYVAGHRGMVGAAVLRRLREWGADQVIVRPSRELDLRDQRATEDFFVQERPEVVIFAAARVGGIRANMTYPAEFIYDNLAMESNTIHAAYVSGCRRFLFLGSTCVYPREAEQPMGEDCLLTGPMELSNEPYAIAKIAGLKLCQYYRQQYGVVFHSVMPTNLYGPGDNYHPENSHVLPGLLRRFHEAATEGHEEVKIWGSGRARREFLHVNDLADAIVYLMQIDNPPDMVNVGSGQDISILELSEMIADVVGFRGRITHDLTMPEGPLRKLTDTTRMERLGWKSKIGLREGIVQTYRTYLDELMNQRADQIIA